MQVIPGGIHHIIIGILSGEGTVIGDGDIHTGDGMVAIIMVTGADIIIIGPVNIITIASIIIQRIMGQEQVYQTA